MIRLVIRDVEGGEASFPVVRELIIGRSRECDIRIDDTSVSRRHAKVYLDYGEAVIEDMGTPNGTLVNRERVVGPLRLKTGDFIQIGTEKIRVMETSPLDDFVSSTEIRSRAVAEDTMPLEAPPREKKTAWDETLPFDKKEYREKLGDKPTDVVIPTENHGTAVLKWVVIVGALLVLAAIAILVITQ